ncbi:MAG TPA: KUP/HAK/KT family potassium transporter, partial [Xanthobacteraceae bacterium]|nr:KUP/HAK/KT family potassium transporter [Xanthobacteraceae bacterium]
MADRLTGIRETSIAARIKPTDRVFFQPMAVSATSTEADDAPVTSGFWSLALGSIGVVFGDIGTSPLYAFREAVAGA